MSQSCISNLKDQKEIFDYGYNYVFRKKKRNKDTVNTAKKPNLKSNRYTSLKKAIMNYSNSSFE
jgi:hypothetical protein